jgi:hypothetical protein
MARKGKSTEEIIAALREAAGHCRHRNQTDIWFRSERMVDVDQCSLLISGPLNKQDELRTRLQMNLQN